MNKIRWMWLLAVCLLAHGSIAPLFPVRARANDIVAAQPDVAEPPVAAYVGRTVVRTTEPLSLHAAWDGTVASGEVPLTDFEWRIDGQVVSTSSELVISISTPGYYALELGYRGPEGRSYEAAVTVRVMEPASYEAMLTAVYTAANLPLWLEDEEAFLPLMMHE